jgi:NAD(P)-dependent dehydrogenase (short-subunit alcohol dehydrogenase family)
MNIFNDRILQGKTVLISGGGTGLGKEMAIGFGKLGANIAIVGRRDQVLKDAAAEIRRSGANVAYSKCDIRDPDQVRNSVEYFIAEFGSITTLVNNAAGNFISKTEDLSLNAFNAVIGIVLNGTVNLTMELGKRWIRGKQSGVVLNISTIYGSTGSGYVVPSAVAKSGVISLTKSLAAEWGKYGIRHVAIAPGIVPTEGAMSRLAPTDNIKKMLVDRIPLKRYGRMDELVNLATFLISDGCPYINGDVISIDGGESIWLSGQFSFLDVLTDQEWEAIKSLRK